MCQLCNMFQINPNMVWSNNKHLMVSYSCSVLELHLVLFNFFFFKHNKHNILRFLILLSSGFLMNLFPLSIVSPGFWFHCTSCLFACFVSGFKLNAWYFKWDILVMIWGLGRWLTLFLHESRGTTSSRFLNAIRN